MSQVLQEDPVLKLQCDQCYQKHGHGKLGRNGFRGEKTIFFEVINKLVLLATFLDVRERYCCV